MTKADRQKLREAAMEALRGVRSRSEPSFCDGLFWQLQTSNSFRRVGQHGDGDVLCAVKQSDGHPDLQAAPGVLDYLVAAQPYVVLKLLDYVDEIETSKGYSAELVAEQLGTIKSLRDEIDRTKPTHEIGELIKVRDTVQRMLIKKLQDDMEHGRPADDVGELFVLRDVVRDAVDRMIEVKRKELDR